MKSFHLGSVNVHGDSDCDDTNNIDDMQEYGFMRPQLPNFVKAHVVA